MSESGRMKSSAYMEWAKLQAHARFNLATSGIAYCHLPDLEVKLDDLDLSGPSYYGYAPLNQALARKAGVPVDCVVAAEGTSGANHLAMAALLDPGDEVLIERPAYELLVATARYLGADVRRFNRPSADGFRLDPNELERALTPKTRLIVLTNLHNPSSALIDEATLRRVGELARGVGARVLIDEVYLDAVFDAPPKSAFQLGTEFVVTSSLTKVYGLSGLRCGWIVAEPDLCRRMWRLNDLFGSIPAHPAERLSVLALAQLERLRERARRILATNRPLLNQFLASRTDLQAPRSEHGTVAFPRLLKGDVETLCQRLFERYETKVVPGRFFDLPQNFRIGIGGDTAVVTAGLERLGAALDEMEG